jgi:5-formyltetrahydrofolate cyclo-ligase
MTKTEIRNIYQKKRNQLSDNDIIHLSKNITSIFIEKFNLTNKKISVFTPIISKKEVNTFPLIDALIQNNCSVYLPKWNINTNLLDHFLYRNDSQLIKNKFGILEPHHGNTISPNELEYVVVPNLIIDIYGNRIGYGKGIYDRFLNQCNETCKFIGLNYFEPFEKCIQTEITDIPIHYCITPSNYYSFV